MDLTENLTGIEERISTNLRKIHSQGNQLKMMASANEEQCQDKFMTILGRKS